MARHGVLDDMLYLSAVWSVLEHHEVDEEYCQAREAEVRSVLGEYCQQ